MRLFSVVAASTIFLFGCGRTPASEPADESPQPEAQAEQEDTVITDPYQQVLQIRDEALASCSGQYENLPVLASTDEQWMEIKMRQVDSRLRILGWYRGGLGQSAAFFSPQNKTHACFGPPNVAFPISGVMWPELSAEQATDISSLCLSGDVWILGMLDYFGEDLGLVTWWVPVYNKSDISLQID